MSARRVARVVVGGQVWVIRVEYAERVAVYPTVLGDQLWPLRADRYDTTAARPLWPTGHPHVCCTRWATATDVLMGQWRVELGGSW